jgi:glucokinase
MAKLHVIGIDLGATQLRAALVDHRGQVLRRAAVLTDVKGGPEKILGQMLKLVEEVAGPDMGHIRAAGICAPGPLDSGTGRIIDISTLPGWLDYPLRETLAAKLSMPVVLENDGIAAAHGEWRVGAGQGLDHLVYVTVSTGIGGGVVVGGKLLRGRRGMAGHIGHMLIDPKGLRCGCGGTGCFEAVASGTAFNARARDAGFHDAKTLTQAARNGDAAALSLVAHQGEMLGYGFVSLLHLYSPDRLIIGGGVSSALDLMLPDIRKQIMRHAMPPFRAVDVVPAALGDNAGLVGAALLAME